MFQFNVSKQKIEALLKSKAVYSPDLMIYDIAEDDYRTFWKQSRHHPREQFYTNGLRIYPISESSRKLDSFLSYLSGSSNCQINRVEMTLAKIAYHGYLKGFNSKNDWQFVTKLPLISKEFSERLVQPREDKNTARLQELLVDYAKTHIKYFYHFSKYTKDTYYFGFALTNNDLFQFVPFIDPQNLDFIKSVVINACRFEKELQKPKHFPTSLFQEEYAQGLLKKSQFESALEWSPTIENQFKKEYIDYYLSSKSKDKSKAIKLIDAWSQDNKNHYQIRRVILNSFQAWDCIKYLSDYPKIKELFVHYYFEQLHMEQKDISSSQNIFGTEYIRYMEQLYKTDRNFIESCLLSSHKENYALFVLMNMGQYEHALVWSNSIEGKFKKDYIDYYLSSSKGNKPKAIPLLDLWYQEHGNQDQTLKTILNHFNIEEQTKYLKDYPTIKEMVLRHYFESAQKEYNNGLLVQLFYGNQYKHYMELVFQLEPNVIDSKFLNSYQEVLILYLFDKASEHYDYKKAWQLFTSYNHVNYSSKILSSLYPYGEQEFLTQTKKISQCVQNQEYNQAISISEQNIMTAKYLAQISNHSNKCIDAIVYYAELILQLDIKQHPVKEADLKKLKGAQQYLNELHFLNSKPNITTINNKIQLRIIDALIELNKVDITYNDNRLLREETNKNHEKIRHELKKQVKLFIQYNQSDNNKPEICCQLAKMNYILGDVLHYFESMKHEAIPYFKEAARLMPQNPYYGLRCEELSISGFESSSEKIRPEDNYPTMYLFWKEVRWLEDRELISGFDIHRTTAKEEGLLHTMSHLITSFGWGNK